MSKEVTEQVSERKGLKEVRREGGSGGGCGGCGSLIFCISEPQHGFEMRTVSLVDESISN